MQISEAYTEWSATYDSDRNLTRDLDHEVLRQYLAGRRFTSALELGCGTGKNTRLLANASKRVVAVDFSAGMIAKAKAKIDLANVEFQSADIKKAWPCRDSSFDFVSCNLVLEHVEDLAHIFREASRVMTLGASFLICELHPYRQYNGTQAKFQRAQETTMIPAFVHHTSDFTKAGAATGLSLEEMNEWWHEEDQGKPPRLISMTFKKLASSARG
jgi:ubiquinone/menaquinone biosynthesis C-methylase UbiE